MNTYGRCFGINTD